MADPILALQFPGQGSQQVGMGSDLLARFPAAAAALETADRALGLPLSRLCLEGPAEELNDTVNTQPAILAVSVAALRALEPDVASAGFVAGHSLGEFSALVAAGALELEPALLLVRERGRLMKEAGEQTPGGMAAVLGLDADEVERACAQARADSGGAVGVANDNCPGQVVISGDERALEAAMERVKAAGARRVVRLAVSIAAHSPLMQNAAAQFAQALQRVTIHTPRIPFVANATAGPLNDPQQIRQALARQLTSPVRWSESVRWMIDQGATRWVEVGPGDVLTGLLRRIDRSVEGRTTEERLRDA